MSVSKNDINSIDVAGVHGDGTDDGTSIGGDGTGMMHVVEPIDEIETRHVKYASVSRQVELVTAGEVVSVAVQTPINTDLSGARERADALANIVGEVQRYLEHVQGFMETSRNIQSDWEHVRNKLAVVVDGVKLRMESSVISTNALQPPG